MKVLVATPHQLIRTANEQSCGRRRDDVPAPPPRSCAATPRSATAAGGAAVVALVAGAAPVHDRAAGVARRCILLVEERLPRRGLHRIDRPLRRRRGQALPPRPC